MEVAREPWPDIVEKSRNKQLLPDTIPVGPIHAPLMTTEVSLPNMSSAVPEVAPPHTMLTPRYVWMA